MRLTIVLNKIGLSGIGRTQDGRSICGACGCVIHDAGKHREWHNQIEQIVDLYAHLFMDMDKS